MSINFRLESKLTLSKIKLKREILHRKLILILMLSCQVSVMVFPIIKPLDIDQSRTASTAFSRFYTSFYLSALIAFELKSARNNFTHIKKVNQIKQLNIILDTLWWLNVNETFTVNSKQKTNMFPAFCWPFYPTWHPSSGDSVIL